MTAGQPPILVMDGVGKTFPGSSRFFGAGGGFRALADVSLSVLPGRTLAIVGESGSGKTTLGRCIVGIHDPTEGVIRFDGRPVSRRGFARDARLRRRVQMIFQDPAASLNPRHRIGTILAEPLRARGGCSPAEVARRISSLLADVGLAADAAGRLPHAFSGGQKQRIAIARALAPEPDLLICDEAVSALDVSVQAQILNLLRDLQERRRLTYVFISHDMAVVRHMADEVAVMQRGRVVEAGSVDEIFQSPRTDYTRALLAAVPRGLIQPRGRFPSG